ncbi:MAG: PTS sugar transporter subunit IIA [Pseudobdellovibrionaceae bacterium]
MQSVPFSIVHFDLVEDRIRVTDTSELFEKIEKLAGSLRPLHTQGALSRDLQTEYERGGVPLGNGAALLATRTDALEEKLVGFIRLSMPQDLGAADKIPCDLIGFVLSPEDDGPLHLRRLARVARLLSQKDVAEKLRQAENADVLQILLSAQEDLFDLRKAA